MISEPQGVRNTAAQRRGQSVRLLPQTDCREEARQQACTDAANQQAIQGGSDEQRGKAASEPMAELLHHRVDTSAVHRE